ncbi:ABC transporter ATP-binding protein [Longirhabdus pacifica]|uniref:ABC transporter ATP-binding protein n=1 Tax=Longirhabdus pacifica TaxID=2305227 RepID=UPI001008F45F|nr:ABC transporter transmembrane domain-containing protein [Longirhabdus pacifica]
MFAALTKLKWFFVLEKKRYIVAISLLILVGALELVPPRLLGNAVDEIVIGSMTSESLWRYISYFLITIAIIYMITYVWIYNLFGGSFVYQRMQRSFLMKHFLKMSPTFYEKNRTGDLMARATNDLQAISLTVGFGVLTLVDSTLYLFFILLAMWFTISWKLTLVALIPMPILALTVNKYGKVIHKRFMKAQDSFGKMNDEVLESVSGVRVIRSYVQERADERKFKGATEDVYEKNMNVAKVDALLEPAIKILIGASYLLCNMFGIYLIFQTELTLGKLVTFNVYLGFVTWPMFAIGQLINVMQRGNASLDRINTTTSYEPDVKDEGDLVEVKRPEEIEFRNVTFRYPSAVDVNQLENVSFRLKRGHTLGVVGKTGSGKSTLIRQLLREYPVGDGQINISNVPIDNIALDTLHQWIGYVPQEQILFSKTVRENIKFSKPNGTDEEMYDAMKLAVFDKDVERLSDGLETLVGEKGVALSGGQKQRISIARALMLDPEILLLDDAMSAVDAKTETSIIRNIQNVRSGKTTIITTHRLSAVQHANWIIVLGDGAIIEEGTHEQLIQRNGWYKQQFDRQQLEQKLDQ